jgi:hypothetical protein
VAAYYPPWNYWVDAGTTASTTTATWTNWTTSTNTTNTTAPWAYWTTNSTANVNMVWGPWVVAKNGSLPQRTPEQIAAAEDAARIAQAQYEERLAQQRADAAEAVKRAETLLHDHLNDRQRRALRTRGAFRVKGESGRWYEVGRGHHGKLTELGRRGKPVSRLCVYATGGCPEADQMLAQKLYLETAEEVLRKAAYITPLAVAA